jgi:CheY-specific phosphatase CheX
MGIKFFGQFLLERGVISSEQLLEILEHQKKKNLRFGEWAVKRGWMDEHYVERLLNAQKRMDMKIGELAVKFRLLTPDDVKKLLNIQRNNLTKLGELIVELGHVSKEILEEEHARFLQDQKPFTPDDINVPEDFRNADALRYILDLTRKYLRRLGSLEAEMGQLTACQTDPEQNFSLVAVQIEGDINCEYVLSVSRNIAIKIASGMLNTDGRNEPDEILSESTKEFCNLVCGNLRSLMRHSGKDLEISYPVELPYNDDDGYRLLRGRDAVSCGISVNIGRASMLIIDTAQDTQN